MSQNPQDYSYVLANIGLSKLIRASRDLQARLDADGRPAQASRVRRAILRHLEEVKEISVQIAELAEKNTVDSLDAGRVRPDTGGAGGPQLREYVGKSVGLAGVPGSVGVNNEAYLDQSPVSWWWTIDQGYDWRYHDDADIRGVFMPGHATPNAAEFQQHPIFRSTGKKGPRMTPMNAIEPQNFVDEGYNRTVGEWHTRIRASKDRLMSEIRAATAAPKRRTP